MEGVREPVDRRLQGLLRRAVLDLATTERRRVHPPVLHVGTPGGAVARLVVGGEPTDPGLRTDLVAAMRARTLTGPGPEPLVWLTRMGPVAETQDDDLRWLAAARSAYAEAGAPLVMVVVDRRGWRDPRSGVARSWVRLRRQSGRPPAGPA